MFNYQTFVIYLLVNKQELIKKMNNSIIPLKLSHLAMLVAKNKHIPISAALCYIYDSPFYDKIYDEEAKWWYLDTESLYKELENSRTQSKLLVSNNVTTFLTFSIERYAQKHNITALESYALFRKYGVDSYLIDGFEVLHTQGEDFILEDIEIYIQNHSKI